MTKQCPIANVKMAQPVSRLAYCPAEARVLLTTLGSQASKLLVNCLLCVTNVGADVPKEPYDRR